ncbi:MAG: ribosome biogenesis GTPase Der [Armatimonadota bacterium]|nr:ribosome biogenesis GTPase Der [Armatimonadota bacterium]MDR7533423.1 ribosome biogenesis GTPase Der [Armatimonadota bacterium]MDR7535209.1 ribosome biogenesis GTPase Der [Armatimonadota bacterium]
MSPRAGLPVVAIVGRPNVGKSALFNRLIGRRVAIVEDVPGVTRDRLYAEAEWRGRRFVVVDTGGLVSDAATGLPGQVRAQATQAAAEADVILLVVDARSGIVPEDRAVADVVRRARAPVLVVANKLDDPASEPAAAEFFALGFGDPLPASALHGRGMGDLLDAVVALLPAGAPADVAAADAAPAVAIVGRPNVGKSSLVNAILGEERVVVDAAPGTTRDAVDTVLERGGRRFVLIDTAGLRRPSRVRETIEASSAARTRRAIERAEVVVLVLDASDPVTDQDQHIARQATDAGCGLVIALNKWDLVASTPRRDPRRERVVRHALRFVAYAPLVVTSAVRGWGIEALLETIAQVAAAHRARISTGVLNRIVGEAVQRNQPPADAAGRRLRIYYATQPESAPPRIVLFVNDPQRMPEAYQRYLERAVREAHPLPGVPLRFVLRRRGETA